MSEGDVVPGAGGPPLSIRERRSAAAALRRDKQAMALRANERFFAAHPDWRARFGPAAVLRGQEDHAFHIEFLAGAVETGEAGAFVDYISWLADVLGARGIGGDAIVESLTLVGDECLALVEEPLRSTVALVLDAGIARARSIGGDIAAGDGASPADECEPTEQWPFDTAAAPFLQAILQGQRHEAAGIAREALRVAKHPSDVYVGLFQRSMEEIGRRWQLNRISVAQEHMATATVQFVLAQVYALLDRSAPTRGTALVTGVEGELHQVGANLVADALELDGWKVRFVGTNLPHDGIVEAALEMKADLIGISATMLFNVNPVARLVENVRRISASKVPRILVGGGAFRSVPQLWREIGADGFAIDLRGACEIARSDDVA